MMNHLEIIDILESQMRAFRREGVNFTRLRIEIQPQQYAELSASSHWIAMKPRMEDVPPTFYGVPVDVLPQLPSPGIRVVALAP